MSNIKSVVAAQKDGWASGTLATGTNDVVILSSLNDGYVPLPSTVFLNSVAGGRQIEWSFDGTNYYVATPDGSNANQIYVKINAGIYSLRFNGTAADAWRIV